LPLGFASARAPDSKWERRMIKEATKFANQVMRYAEDCGIDPSQFLEAAARFGEEAPNRDTLAHFMQLCLEDRKPGTFAEMARIATAATHIGKVGKSLDRAMFAIDERSRESLPIFHGSCSSKPLSYFAETMAANLETSRSTKRSSEVFR